jgi:hypothetical protein
VTPEEPTDSSPIEDEYDRAWSILKTHVGHLHPIKSRILAQRLGMSDAHKGTRSTRALIAELVRRGLPVGATEDGYFLLENPVELERYLNERSDRVVGIMHGSELVQRAFQTYYKGGEAQQKLIRWVPEDPEERV